MMNWTTFIVRRWASSSFIACAKNTGTGSMANRQVKIMNKLMFGRKNKAKKGWYDSEPSFNQFTSAQSISNPVGVKKHTNRRITVLNKLFMKNITDLMANGEMTEEILGRGVEVSRVKVAPDFQIVNVYWLAKGSEDDAEIEKLLRKCSGLLRHELSQLRVMGEVPRIHFVKDIEFAKYVEVERLLKSADLGGEEVDATEDELDEIIDVVPTDCMPEMRHDVLGLRHSGMLATIQNKLKITRTAWQEYEAKKDPLTTSQSNASQVITATDDLNDRIHKKRLQDLEREERFAQFLLKKRISKQVQRGSSRDLEARYELDPSTVTHDDEMDVDEPDEFDEEFYK